MFAHATFSCDSVSVEASTDGLHGDDDPAHHDVLPGRHEAAQPLRHCVQRAGGYTAASAGVAWR